MTTNDFMATPEKRLPSSYKYQPLPHNAHTRVLDLQPSIDPGAPLCGSLRFVNLELDPFFDALSYTWGEPLFNEEIIIDQISSLKITKNLYEGLARFRLPTEVRHLWVDALCINQSDSDEKARQIPLMAQIYRGATSVLVWLGNSQDGSAHMRHLALLTQGLSGAERVEDLELALDALVQLPWFSRRWIIQEVSLNPNIILYCGNSMIPWLTVLRLPSMVKERKHNYKHHIDTFRKLWEFHVLNTGLKLEILDILSAFSEAGCADSRDRIYALAGLATDVKFTNTETDSRKLLIKIDYTKSVEKVFKDFAAAVVTRYVQTGSHVRNDLFDHTTNRADGSNLNGHCSWAPDWRLPVARRQLRFHSLMRNLRLSRDGQSDTAYLYNVFYVGIVGDVFNPFPSNADLEHTISWTKDIFEILLGRMIANRRGRPLEESEVKILWIQLLDTLSASKIKEESSCQLLGISKHFDVISTHMKGRVVLTVLSAAISDHEDSSWPQLGIGPSHTLPGDILCSNEMHNEGWLVDGSYVSGWYWTPSLVFRETHVSKNARIKPLTSYTWQEGQRNISDEEELHFQNIKMGVSGLPLLDWKDFEFDLVGEIYTNEIEKEESPTSKRVSTTVGEPVGKGRRNDREIYHVRSMAIH